MITHRNSKRPQAQNEKLGQERQSNLSQVAQNAASSKLVDNSPQVKQMKGLANVAAQSPQAQKLTQLQSIANGGGEGSLGQMAQAPKENRTGLPDKLKSGIENLGGYSMDDVRVHYNSSKPAQLQAHAYAQGTDIHIAPGQEKHLPHEAWHVVQQKQGRVKPTLQMKGIAINDDSALEKEADVMGDRAMGGLESQEPKMISNISSIGQLKESAPIDPMQEVVQGMFVPYTKRDLGYDDTDKFADETIGTVVFERVDRMEYTKTDGSNSGSIKHYVPYNWIMKNLADKWVIGFARRHVHANLKKILNHLKIPVPKDVNPTVNRISFDTWVSTAVYLICDWEENLFKDVPSGGDGKGTKLDIPNDAGVKARVAAAQAELAKFQLDQKV